jgi:pimeloyl-ACP methyl ester carboxylesterase
MEEVHRTIGSSQLHHEFSPDYRGILNSNIKCAKLLKEFSVDDDRPVVFFLHGYNTSFEQALHQTRKLSAEIGGSVTLALWSWASLGLKSGYLADLDHIQLGMHSATRFLNSLTPDVRVGQFQVLSHSMGGNLAMHFASEASSLAILSLWQRILSEENSSELIVTGFSEALTGLYMRLTMI